MSKFECTCGFGPQKKFDSNRMIHVKNDLSPEVVTFQKLNGFTEVRDPGFSQGRGTSYLIKNKTHETDAHFILWNLIFDEIKKYTPTVKYNLVREPDIVFTLDDGLTVAVEVEATKKSENQLKPKLAVLKKYNCWFFVVTKCENLKHYRQYGLTFTRTWARKAIAAYFGLI